MRKFNLIRKVLPENIRLEVVGFKHNTPYYQAGFVIVDNYNNELIEVQPKKFLDSEWLVTVHGELPQVFHAKDMKTVKNWLMIERPRSGITGHKFKPNRKT